MALPGECIATGADDNSKSPRVTPLKVMRSAAGYYIGTGYFDPDLGFEEPWTRESACYYGTSDEAQRELDNDTYPRRG